MPKIEMGKQYKTRDGHEVVLFTTNRNTTRDKNGRLWCVVALIKHPDRDDIFLFDENGRVSCVESNDHGYDLIEVKPRIKRKLYCNVYPHKPASTSAAVSVWSERKLADQYAMPTRIACVEIEIDCEEGEGLS